MIPELDRKVKYICEETTREPVVSMFLACFTFYFSCRATDKGFCLAFFAHYQPQNSEVYLRWKYRTQQSVVILMLQ